jgi:hypothetical protein
MQNNHINSQKYLSFCPECGAPWQVGLTCADCFHQMLYWENENPLLGAVHHLMVLAYHLQHPSLYSPEGLAYSLQLLADFLKHDLTPEQARKQNRFVVSSEPQVENLCGAIRPCLLCPPCFLADDQQGCSVCWL